jgi:hypothetical protein
MNDLALAGAQGFRLAPRNLPMDMTRVPLTMPENSLFLRDMANTGLKSRNDTRGLNRAGGMSEVEVPFRLNISAKAAFGLMLVAVVNLIPVLAPALMGNP